MNWSSPSAGCLLKPDSGAGWSGAQRLVYCLALKQHEEIVTLMERYPSLRKEKGKVLILFRLEHSMEIFFP